MNFGDNTRLAKPQGLDGICTTLNTTAPTGWDEVQGEKVGANQFIYDEKTYVLDLNSHVLTPDLELYIE